MPAGTTDFSLDYNNFKKHYKVIVADWSEQQVLGANPKAIQQINSIGNLIGNNNRVMLKINYWKFGKKNLDFSQGTVKVL